MHGQVKNRGHSFRFFYFSLIEYGPSPRHLIDVMKKNRYSNIQVYDINLYHGDEK